MSNQPASPFYFLSTSTFTNPVFTRRDLLSFLDYWKEVIDLGVALSSEIANRPFEEGAIRSLGVVRDIEREYDLEDLYGGSDVFNAQGYMLTGLFRRESNRSRFVYLGGTSKNILRLIRCISSTF